VGNGWCAVRCLELFAGAGGAALGLERAGIEHSAAIEVDPAACATLRAARGAVIGADATDIAACESLWRQLYELDAWNAAGDELVAGDLGDDDEDPDVWMTARETLADAMVADAMRVDLLWSSPPCPLHSRANSRRRAVAFDGWPATVAWVDAVNPEWVTVENVGAALAEARGRWTADLVARGYACVSAILDAADFGAPQRRRRTLLMARKGGPVALPEPTHSATSSLYTQPHRTLGDAVPALRDSTDGLLRYTQGRAGSEPWRLEHPAPTVMCTEVKGTRASAASGWTFHGGPDRASDAAYLAVGRRRLTWEECAALQGFPAGYPFQGSTTERYRQIGNAVPPCLAEAVGRAILAML